MSSKLDFKLSEEDAKILSVLKADGYCTKSSRNNEVWIFWFDDLVCFNLTEQTFYNLCVWDDELAFSQKFKLPTTVLPLSQNLGTTLAETVQERFLTHTAHSVLLEEDTNV